MVLVDYRGFRLLAMTVLPIRGAETLLYGSVYPPFVLSVELILFLLLFFFFFFFFFFRLGSADAGRTIVNKDPVVNSKMKLLGEKLHLKPHKVHQCCCSCCRYCIVVVFFKQLCRLERNTMTLLSILLVILKPIAA